MARGFDLIAAESVIEFKKDYEINLTACLPCANQSEKFSASVKSRYENVLSNCNKIITLSPAYYSGCMHERDRYMVDNSDIVVCFLRLNSGGTYYTVNYARRKGKKIIEL